jgi:hypothetical protein
MEPVNLMLRQRSRYRMLITTGGVSRGSQTLPGFTWFPLLQSLSKNQLLT